MADTLSLRERNKAEARRAILEAFAEEVAAGGLDDLTIDAVAARASVSPRTVYRYFPTREALLDGFDEWQDQQIGLPPLPLPPAEIPDVVERLFQLFDEQ